MYKYNMGGTVPRETTIGGQRHNLAYINPFEEDLLQQYRQDAPTVPGPGGVPAYASKPDGSVRPKARSQASQASKDFMKDMMDRSSASVTRSPRPVARPQAVTAPRYVDPFATTAVPGDAMKALTARAAANVDLANYQKQQSGSNSIPERIANAFTGNDGLRYVDGNLVYDVNHKKVIEGEVKAGSSALGKGELNTFGVEAGGFNSIANDSGGSDILSEIMGKTYKIPAKETNIIDDVKMGYDAGFGSYEKMAANLRAAGYDDQTIQDYISRTKATQARNSADQLADITGGSDNGGQAGLGVGGIDPFAYTGGGTPGKPATDPCPEGFIMDPKTNACVPMDATNSGYQGLPSYIMPDPSVPLTDFSRPAVIGQPNLQPYASGTGGNFIQGSNVNQGAPRGYANGGEVGEDKSYSERIIDKAVELFGDASELSISKVIELGSKAAPYAKLAANPIVGATDILMEGSGILADEFFGVNPFARPQSNAVQKFNQGGPVGGIMDLLR